MPKPPAAPEAEQPAGTIQQAYRFALDPTPTQQRAFASHAGGSRYAFNRGVEWIGQALDARVAELTANGEVTTKVPGHFDLCKTWTAFKNDPANGLHWAGENFVGTYQAALRDAHMAWRNFFDSRSGRRAGRRAGRPRLKKKGRCRDSFQVHGGTLQVVDAHHVKLPKIGLVKTHESTRKLLSRVRDGRARIIRGTINRTADRWHIALTVEVQRQHRPRPSARQRAGGTVGVDLGVRHLATLSTGEHVPNPRHLSRAQRRLRRAQQTVARRQKGSGRRRKATARVARLHARVANLRVNAVHQLTTKLAHTHELVAIEDLNVAGMTRSARGTRDAPGRNVRAKAGLNRAILDSAFGLVRWQLSYKSRWYGAQLHVVDRYYPSSKTCSSCGVVTAKLPLAERTYRCHACGLVTDRDLNAARNLAAHAAAARRQHHDAGSGPESENARGEDVSPPAARRRRQSPMKREARSGDSSPGQTGTPGGQPPGVPTHPRSEELVPG